MALESEGHRYAITATMDTILTHARRTAITGLIGLRVESSSALVRGMAGAVVGEAGAVVGASTVASAGLVSADAASVVAALVADADSPVDADLTVEEDLHMVRRVASTAAVDFMVAAVSTVEAVAVSTVEVAAVSTVEAVDMAVVDTGNREVIRSSLVR